MIRWSMEASALFWARTTFGDVAVADMLADQEYDPDFAQRHSKQLAGIAASKIDQVIEDEQ